MTLFLGMGVCVYKVIATQSFNHSINQSINRSIVQSFNRSIAHTGPFDFVNKLLKNSDGVDLVGEVGVVDCGFDTASERRVLGRVRN